MAIKLRFDSKKISEKEYRAVSKGYDPLEVDMYMDGIASDYEKIESGMLLSKEEYQTIENEIANLKKENIDLKVALDKEKNKWKYVKNDGKDIHIDNLVLLRRIGKLEKIIHDKLHLNPDDITFDLDDC